MPDLVAVPSALGDGIQGIWRGFRDLADVGGGGRDPADGGGRGRRRASPASLAGGKDWVAPSGDVHSLARSLGGVTGTVQTLQAVVESEGLVVRVTDAELETARIVLGETEGCGSSWARRPGWRPRRSCRRAATSPPERSSSLS